MSFSAELLDLAKTKLGLTKDAQLLELIPHMEKGNLSKVKNGVRPLSDDQALAVALHCDLNPEWVLVNLAAEVAERKSNEPLRSVWAGLAKKLSKAALVFVVAGLLNSGLVPDLGKHRFLARSRLFV